MALAVEYLRSYPVTRPEVRVVAEQPTMKANIAWDAGVNRWRDQITGRFAESPYLAAAAAMATPIARNQPENIFLQTAEKVTASLTSFIERGRERLSSWSRPKFLRLLASPLAKIGVAAMLAVAADHGLDEYQYLTQPQVASASEAQGAQEADRLVSQVNVQVGSNGVPFWNISGLDYEVSTVGKSKEQVAAEVAAKTDRVLKLNQLLNYYAAKHHHSADASQANRLQSYSAVITSDEHAMIARLSQTDKKTEFDALFKEAYGH